MDFRNPLENPLECEYEFPLSQSTVISDLQVKIGKKEIVAIVKE